MASTSANLQNGSAGTPHNAYGDVIVESGARAQLGDIWQDISINGGLHLHFHASSKVLSAAVTIQEFVQIGTRLLRLGDAFRQQSVAAMAGVERLSVLLKDLSFVRSQLEYHKGPYDTNTATEVCILLSQRYLHMCSC